MVDAVVSGVVELLGIILVQQMEQEVKLVVGVKEEIRSLKRKFLIIQAVLDDAEKRQVNESSVRLWLAELKDVSYDVEDVLDEWNTAILKSIIQKKQEKEETTNQISCVTMSLKKVCFVFPFHCFRFNRLVLRHDIAHKIKQLNVRLDTIEYERRTYNFVEGRGAVLPERQITASIVDVSEVHGRDKDKDKLLSMLLNGSSEEVSGLCIISIVGMGGLGKTTLARLVYNEDLIKAHFHKRAWVCVSDPFDEKKIALSILEELGGVAPNVNELQTLLNLMSHALMGKKVLLVLDDVWTDDYEKWEQLRNTIKCCSPGSRVLVTTRKDVVANMLGTKYLLKPSFLSKEACWSVFSQVAFFDRSDEERSNLEDLGRNIVERCNGLPLAAKVMGSLLRFKKRREEWEYVLYNKIWELDISERLFAPLLLSYYDLSFSVRRCFLYCAIFPKDYRIDTDELIYMWMAQGLLSSTRNIEMKELGKEYINILVTRSFFQYLDKGYGDKSVYCIMHDLVHDLAQYLTMGECFSLDSKDGDQEASKFNTNNGKARHLTLILERDTPFPFLVNVEKRLRSIKISVRNESWNRDGVPNNYFDQLKYLRTLDMSMSSVIRKLVENVGKLVHLRYLNLSRNKRLEELPESLCDLCNLQTLNINYCSDLKRLPRGMGKLVNLRHLENEETEKVRFMPKGIKKLTSMVTLKLFVVSENGDDSEAMTLGDLKFFKNLRGSLTIKGLGNLKNVEEAKQVFLGNIVKLELDFKGERAESAKHEDILEAIQPSPQLQQLIIKNYGGATMCPSWVTSLTKLTYLWMLHFENLEHLPSLGNLSSLETLRIATMDKVKTVDVEFLEPTPSSVSSFIAFPKLKTLFFWRMRNWEEWNYRMKTSEECSGSTKNITMPQLRSLTVRDCPKLKALPDFLLQTVKLKISDCPILDRGRK